MRYRLPVMLLLLTLTASVMAHELGEIQVETLAKSQQSWDGRTLPAWPTTPPEVTVLNITIPPHSRLPLHKHPVINAGVLLRGELTVVAESGERLQLKAGEAIVELVDRWHYGSNERDEPAQIIVFYAGTPGTPITVIK